VTESWPQNLPCRIAVFLVLCAAIPLAATWAADEQGWPRQLPGENSGGVRFVDDASCAGCHRQAYDDWSDSHHDRAMQPASEQTVLGDFDDARFTHFGITSRFFRRDGRFFVNTDGPDGQLSDFEITYTFGIEPLQQYLIALPGGRLQALSIAWDTGKRRWFHLYPEENIDHEDRLHWTGRAQNWNAVCADCHSTDLRKRYDAASDAYRTAWHAINVGCQACHGPGEAHVEWARGSAKNPGTPYTDSALVVSFKAGDSRHQVDTCARCHARRHAVSPQHEHGRPLLDDYMPELLRETLYHADGQILDEVYVYGSFLQSRMYQAGVACSDCHDPHSLKLKRTGNALCLQCHQEQPNPRFAGLKAKSYDTPAHHFHSPDTAGAQCVNCHMPAKTYMVVDPRRDHSFRIPRPDLSVKLGTPNACNICHTDKTSKWAADAIREWYGPEQKKTPHYAEAIAAGRSGSAAAPAKLDALARDAREPAIVRATALDLLGMYGPVGAATMMEALQDKDPLVRATAARGLEHAPPEQRLAAVAPLLSDPIRAVRSEAARVLASVPAAQFNAAQRAAFDEALAEYEATQIANSDWPAAHLNLAVLQTLQGRPDLAEQSYRTAVALDRDFLPARVNLANLYNALGRNQDAERTLREAIEHAPDEGELHYSLGLLLAEEQRLEDASLALGEAARLLPERTRVHYNYGLALQRLGRREQAESELLVAHRLQKTDPNVLQALVAFYAQQRQWDRAYPYAKRLVSLYPNAPGPRQMLMQIEALQKFGTKSQ
jgi:predicted CXXCH cytochrome family protein